MTHDGPELDPAFIAALREVPEADDTTRERHLGAALAEIRVSERGASSRRPSQWIAYAAASIVLVALGFAVGTSTRGSNTVTAGGDTVAASNTAMVVKGGVAGAASSTDSSLESPCSVDSALTMLMRFETAKGRMIAYVRIKPSAAIIVMDESTCSVLREMDLP